MNGDLKIRVQSALIAVGIVALALLLSWSGVFPKIVLALITLAVVVGGCYEFARCGVAGGQKDQSQALVTFFALASAPIVTFLGGLIRNIADITPALARIVIPVDILGGVICAVLIAVAHLMYVARNDLVVSCDLEKSYCMGIPLLALGGGALVGFSWLLQGESLLLFLMLSVFLNDTAAYFVGSKVGGMKLAPAISPKKTVAGALGGLLAGAVVGIFFSKALIGASWITPHWYGGILVGVILAFAGQLGDLMKSVVKRHYGVKDMGTIMPGHGGIVDRIDGLLMAAPVLLLFLIEW